jgi:hypothetical protein
LSRAHRRANFSVKLGGTDNYGRRKTGKMDCFVLVHDAMKRTKSGTSQPTMHRDITDAIAVLRSLVEQRRLKMTDVAAEIGVPYRSLQNYLYGTTRMPLEVYIELCAHVGVTADYPFEGRFKLDHHTLQKAIADVFGDSISGIDVSRDSVLSVGPSQRSLPKDHVQRVAGFLAALIAGRYDVLREADLLQTDPK